MKCFLSHHQCDTQFPIDTYFFVPANFAVFKLTLYSTAGVKQSLYEGPLSEQNNQGDANFRKRSVVPLYCAFVLISDCPQHLDPF